MPGWVHVAAVISIVLAGLSALVITGDLLRSGGQKMKIMNVVWPVTALWAGPFGAWAYFRYGRAGSARAAQRAEQEHRSPPNKEQPYRVLVAKAATHCGSGCTVGDLIAETFALAIPLHLFGQKIFGTWLYDFVLAFALGILFQYFTIKPMKHLSRGKGLIAALKADTLSLTAWQVGMYGWMALVTFVFVGHELPKSTLTFWFMMQVAMGVGFLTSYPVNWWLVRTGIKERM